jgi:hypothetical protein
MLVYRGRVSKQTPGEPFLQCGGERSRLRDIALLLVLLVVGAVLSALLDTLSKEESPGSYMIMVLIFAVYFAINYGPTLLV